MLRAILLVGFLTVVASELAAAPPEVAPVSPVAAAAAATVADEVMDTSTRTVPELADEITEPLTKSSKIGWICFPAAYSHYMLALKVSKELARRGHEVGKRACEPLAGDVHCVFLVVYF